jgi:hypothetical protein
MIIGERQRRRKRRIERATRRDKSTPDAAVPNYVAEKRLAKGVAGTLRRIFRVD